MDNSETLLELNDLEDRINNLDLSTNLEKSLRSKIDSGHDLTDQEIFIATETVGFLAIKHRSNFTGFGFEEYINKSITQKQKSMLALEAIEKYNKEETEALKNKFENLKVDEENFKSLLTGSLDKIEEEAQELLKGIENIPESEFTNKEIDDIKVQKITFRGFEKQPFKKYNEILSAVKDSIDSLDVLSRVSKYESTGSGKDSKYDLSKLAKDMGGRIVKREDGKVTYDVNHNKLCGLDLFLTVPENSDSSYLMRNLKANFVVKAKTENSRVLTAKLNHSVKSLNKKECINLLNSIISFVDKEKNVYQDFYKEAKLSLDSFKFLIPIVGYNKLLFKAKINDLNSVIHFVNLTVLRGLMTWILRSIK